MQVCRTERDAARHVARKGYVHRFAAVAALILVATATASAPAATTHTVRSHGLTLQVPAGWRVSHGPWSYCESPTQVLALVTGKHPVRAGGLLLMLEYGIGAEMSSRPQGGFQLPAKSSASEGCCGMPTAPGYAFTLVEQGRAFQIFLWARDRGVAKAAVEALNTLRFLPG
jgi:hypothetical protein